MTATKGGPGWWKGGRPSDIRPTRYNEACLPEPGGSGKPEGFSATTTPVGRPWTAFKIHHDAIVGALSTFDRLIFKGYITSLFPAGSMGCFLSRQGVLLRDFKTYATVRVRRDQGPRTGLRGGSRPPVRLSGAGDHQAPGPLQRGGGTRDGSFTVRSNPATRRLQVARKPTKCLVCRRPT